MKPRRILLLLLAGAGLSACNPPRPVSAVTEGVQSAPVQVARTRAGTDHCPIPDWARTAGPTDSVR